MTKANPHSLDEIERGYKPVEYRESDLSPVEMMALGLGIGYRNFMRVAVVYAVDKNDANKLIHLCKVLGPATGGTKVSVPCGGAVEWAQVQECMEYRTEMLGRRELAKTERLLALQGAIDTQLPDIADQMEKQSRGHSTFGEHGFLQRASS